MQVKSISVTDYSTGTKYTYSGTSGTWDSIQAAGGKVNSGGGIGVVPVVAAPPTVTPSSNSAPMPFEGTHRDTSSTYVTPNIYPWVPTTLQKSPVATVTTYPGLPSGWTVTDDGKVLPPSAAPVSELPSHPWASERFFADRQLTCTVTVHAPADIAYLIAVSVAAGLSVSSGRWWP